MRDLYQRANRRARSTVGSFVRFLGTKRGGLYFDRDHDYRNTVLVAGSGRGGTTWVAELINSTHEFRDIFEPFNPSRVKLCRHFANRQYLRPQNDDPQYLDPARVILSGRLRSDWSDAYNRRIVCHKRLIKDIRVNLLLKWIHRHFPEVPIIFVLRHPCAVAHSRMHLGWGDSLEDLLTQEPLVEDYLKPFLPAIKRANSSFERHLILWCIDNYVPLQELRRDEALTIFYEDLCKKPDASVKRLAEFLKLDSQELMLKRVGKPSSQTRKRTSAIMLGEDPITAWQKHLSPEMLDQANRTLELFGLSRVYGSGAAPLVDADNVLR